MVSKIGLYIDIKILKSIYHAIFESHLSYALLVWTQSSSSVDRLHILEKFTQANTFFKIEILTQVFLSIT